MTITLDASPHVLALLDGANVRYTVIDHNKALAEERERGKKYRVGSPKHAAHVERLKRLEDETCTDSCRTSPITAAGGTRRVECGVSISKKSPSSPPVSRMQEDAVLALIVLSGCKRDAAENAVARCHGDDAGSWALNAQKELER